jgi:hypothetical protein
MQDMLNNFQPVSDSEKMSIMVDVEAGQVLQNQNGNCIVFASEGPPLLQLCHGNVPSSFRTVQDEQACITRAPFYISNQKLTIFLYPILKPQTAKRRPHPSQTHKL